MFFQVVLTNEGENNRYRALPPSFLSARANGNNSSEGATSTLNSCKDKSLMVLEELPTGDMDTSLVKTLTANDELSARALYKDASQFVPRGKLLVNTNHSPKTQDTALWDRMVLIPFDVRYAGDGEEVDEDNWLLASDAAKVDELKELKDAFVTVCLKDYHLLRKTNPTEIPLPACVKEMMKQRRQESMPLGQFMDKFTTETKVPELFSAALAIFQAYRHHRRNVMREYDQDNTYTKFMESMRRLNKYDIVMNDKDQEFVVGRSLIPEAQDMARKESDNQPFGVYHDKSIISAFKRQQDRVNRKRLREMETKEDYTIVEIPGSMTPAEVSRRLEKRQKQDDDLLNCPNPPRSPNRMQEDTGCFSGAPFKRVFKFASLPPNKEALDAYILACTTGVDDTEKAKITAEIKAAYADAHRRNARKRMRMVEPQEATESDEEAQHERMRADEERIETEEYQVNVFISLFRQIVVITFFFSQANQRVRLHDAF